MLKTKRPIWVSALLLALTANASACAGLWHRIDRDALDRIPNDEKLALFDAENEVIIAKDNIEAIERFIADSRKAVDKAREKVQFLKENTNIAGINSPEVLELYQDWAKLKYDLREDELRHLYLRREVADHELWLARARYELAKAQLVHDHDPERGAAVDVAAFESQVADKEGVVAEGQARIDESRIAVEEINSRYDAVSQRLQEASGGAFGGPWAD